MGRGWPSKLGKSKRAFSVWEKLLAIPLSPGATYGSVAQHNNGLPSEGTAVRAIAMALSGVKNICSTTGTAVVAGAELQPIARPATTSVNVMAIVRILMGDSLLHQFTV